MFYDPIGRELQWPTPWEGIGLPWYHDCRERAPSDVLSDAAQAAMQDLIQTLRTKPSTYWLRADAELQLQWKFGINNSTARQLLRTCPGGVLLADGVWCSTAAAPAWTKLKRRVHAALKPDTLMTVAEMQAAAKTDEASAFAALARLCEGHVAVAIRNSPTEELFFGRIRAGRDGADYSDLYAARAGSAAPQPAA